MKQLSKGNYTHEEEEEYDDEFTARKEPNLTIKDVKNMDKASAVRSKHSVTEQRRRSKINERYQILRDLVPQGDQKRDTASFLLEVIEYVQLLQEKVQKYEGPYPGWSGEPTKLMPWRHSHWRVQSFLGLPQAIKNGPEPDTIVSAKLDEKNISISPSMPSTTQMPVDPDSSREAYRPMDQQPELLGKAAAFPTPITTPTTLQNDGMASHLPPRAVSAAPAADHVITDNDQQEHTIEGGTINISSAYSHELLTTLTQALHSSGVDLSQASISIRIDLGKRADPSLMSGSSNTKEQGSPVSCDRGMAHGVDGSNDGDLEQDRKRLRM